MEKAAHLVRLSLVGVARFELAALRSRTVRATKLRYTPIVVVLFHSSNRNVSLCLVARLALTEGFAAVQSARHSCPCRDASSFRCRCLMQPKLRYTPIVVFSCFISSLRQECSLLFGSASRAHRRFCCRTNGTLNNISNIPPRCQGINNISNIPPRCQGIRPACRDWRAKH